MYGFIEADDYELYHDLHGPDDYGLHCVSRYDAGVMPYWNGGEEGDVYEGDVALHRTVTNESVNRVVHTSGMDDPGGPCNNTSNIYQKNIALTRTGSDEPVSSVVCVFGSVGPGGPFDENVDFYEGDVAQHQNGSDQTVNVVCMVGPGRWQTLPET